MNGASALLAVSASVTLSPTYTTFSGKHPEPAYGSQQTLRVGLVHGNILPSYYHSKGILQPDSRQDVLYAVAKLRGYDPELETSPLECGNHGSDRVEDTGEFGHYKVGAFGEKPHEFTFPFLGKIPRQIPKRRGEGQADRPPDRAGSRQG